MRRCRKSSSRCEDDVGSAPVYLNVYDLTPLNGYAYWLGLGVYHSGVQVYGVEYAFGAHEHPSTGIFEGEPKQCDGFTFRKTILVGRTAMGAAEVQATMEELAEEYRGNAYNLITKNCNHFCNDACKRLTGNHIPRWVNRLARIGFLCNCIIPVNLSMAKIHEKSRIEEKACEESKDLSSRCISFTSSSSNLSSPSSSSSSCSIFRSRSRRSRSSLPPSTPLVTTSSSSY